MAHPYSTQADLQFQCGGLVRLVALTDLNQDRVPDADVIATAIANADAMIDSYLGKVYFVPLAAPTPDIVRLSSRLARNEILEAKGLVDDNMRKSHEADLLWLSDVRDGKIVIPLDPQPTASTMRVDSSTERPTSKDYSRAKLAGFS